MPPQHKPQEKPAATAGGWLQAQLALLQNLDIAAPSGPAEAGGGLLYATWEREEGQRSWGLDPSLPAHLMPVRSRRLGSFRWLNSQPCYK